MQILTFKSHPCFLQIPQVEDVKTKLSCDASFKLKKLKIKSEAFVQCFLQISRVEDVSTCLRAAVPMHKVSQHVKHNSTALSRKRESHVEPSVPVRGHFEVDPTMPETVAHTRTYFFPRPKLRLPEKTQCFVQILTFKSHP